MPLQAASGPSSDGASKNERGSIGYRPGAALLHFVAVLEPLHRMNLRTMKVEAAPPARSKSRRHPPIGTRASPPPAPASQWATTSSPPSARSMTRRAPVSIGTDPPAARRASTDRGETAPVAGASGGITGGRPRPLRARVGASQGADRARCGREWGHHRERSAPMALGAGAPGRAGYDLPGELELAVGACPLRCVLGGDRFVES
jgi:hypothetical protein